MVFAVGPSIVAALLGGATAAARSPGGLALLALPWLLGLADTRCGPTRSSRTAATCGRSQRKLREIRPLVIGISGSFGKMTTKAAWPPRSTPTGRAYPTPASFNSFLGVVRAINEGLEPRHETFVAELGSYRIGDVAELCEPGRAEDRHPLPASGRPPGALRLDGRDRAGRGASSRTRCRPTACSSRAPTTSAAGASPATKRCCRELLSAPPASRGGCMGREHRGVRRRNRVEIRWRDDPDPLAVRSRLLGEPNVANLLAAAAGARPRRHAGSDRPRAQAGRTSTPARADRQRSGRHRGDRRLVQLEPRRRRRALNVLQAQR